MLLRGGGHDFYGLTISKKSFAKIWSNTDTDDWVFYLKDYIRNTDIIDMNNSENLKRITELFYMNDINEIPIVINDKIIGTVVRNIESENYNWSLIDQHIMEEFFAKWRTIYISSLESDNLIKFYEHFNPQLPIRLIHQDNVDSLLEEDEEALFIYEEDVYSYDIKVTRLSCGQLARELADTAIDFLKERLVISDEWGSIQEEDVCLEKVVQLMDEGYKTIHIIDDNGVFQGAICRHKLKEQFLYREIPHWNNLFADYTDNHEKLLEEVSKIFFGTSREEVAIIKEGRITASCIRAKGFLDRRFNGSFELRWDLISDKTALEFFKTTQQDRTYSMSVLLSSDRGYLRGFKERFSKLIEMTLFTEACYDDYISGRYDWLIYGMDIWCETPTNKCSIEELFLTLLWKEVTEWLNNNNVDYFYFESPQNDKIWNLSRRWASLDVHVPSGGVEKNGYRVSADMCSPIVNSWGGNRFTKDTPEEYIHTIYVYGPCLAWGLYCEDNETVESFLQARLNEKGFKYRVVNCGVIDSAVNSLYRILDTDFKSGDMVIHSEKEAWTDLYMTESINWYETSSVFNYITNCMVKCFVKGEAIHLNGEGNKILADYIYKRLENDLRKEKVSRKTAPSLYNRRDHGINKKEVQEYVDYLAGFRTSFHKVGCIVMNCNPFTLGHYYLVEKGSGFLDYLYVFVVEEDKSDISFEDRYKMAVENCKHFHNVKVLPSGKYIISSLTFGEYFRKDMLQNQVVIPSLDVSIFGKYIAPALNITVRLVGEEPYDRVTEQYNRTMRKLLPQYGIEVMEIPRYEVMEKAVSASEVRRLLKEGNWERVQQYLPEETLKILKQRYQ